MNHFSCNFITNPPEFWLFPNRAWTSRFVSPNSSWLSNFQCSMFSEMRFVLSKISARPHSVAVSNSFSSIKLPLSSVHPSKSSKFEPAPPNTVLNFFTDPTRLWQISVHPQCFSPSILLFSVLLRFSYSFTDPLRVSSLYRLHVWECRPAEPNCDFLSELNCSMRSNWLIAVW